jgi:hypothetical protein
MGPSVHIGGIVRKRNRLFSTSQLIIVAAGACAASFAVAPALASGSSDTSGDLDVAAVGMKADSNEVAVEGITLCHEGFEIS